MAPTVALTFLTEISGFLCVKTRSSAAVAGPRDYGWPVALIFAELPLLAAAHVGYLFFKY